MVCHNRTLPVRGARQLKQRCLVGEAQSTWAALIENDRVRVEARRDSKSDDRVYDGVEPLLCLQSALSEVRGEGESPDSIYI